MVDLIRMVGMFVVSGVLISPNEMKMVEGMDRINQALEKCKNTKI